MIAKYGNVRSAAFYTPISNKNSDCFVSVDTYQRLALDPQVLHILISKRGKVNLP